MHVGGGGATRRRLPAMKVIGGVQGTRSYYAMQKWGPGIVLRPADHPEAKPLPDGIHDAILLDEGIPRIDAENWTALQLLFIKMIEEDPRGEHPVWSRSFGHMMPSLEVAVIFYLDYERTHWLVVTARQVVSGASVQEDRTRGGINIVTGERYPVLPPPGYDEFGTAHSHNTMQFPQFSGTDDANELHINGWHILCSCYSLKNGGWEYRITPSVVAGGKRYQAHVDPDTWEIKPLEEEQFIDLEWKDSIELHPDVMGYITREYPKNWNHQQFRQGHRKTPITQFDLIPFGKKTVDDVFPGFDTSFEVFMEYLESRVETRDVPGQTLMWDDDELQVGTKVQPELEKLVELMDVELESILDCIEAMNRYTSRRVTAEVLSKLLNNMKPALFRKVKPLKSLSNGKKGDNGS